MTMASHLAKKVDNSSAHWHLVLCERCEAQGLGNLSTLPGADTEEGFVAPVDQLRAVPL